MGPRNIKCALDDGIHVFGELNPISYYLAEGVFQLSPWQLTNGYHLLWHDVKREAVPVWLLWYTSMFVGLCVLRDTKLGTYISTAYPFRMMGC